MSPYIPPDLKDPFSGYFEKKPIFRTMKYAGVKQNTPERNM
jgi:hypothetical protein